MKRRFVPVAAIAAVTVGAALLACVDLFHTTNFDTLCTVSPDDPRCPEAGATDAATDRKVDAPDTSRPHPDFCSWTSKQALEQAKRACAWLGACEGPANRLVPPPEHSVLSVCLFRAQLAFDCKATPTLRPKGAVDEFWACLATASSCGELHRCIFPQDQPCAPVKTTVCSNAIRSETVRLECVQDAANGTPAGVEPCLISGQTCADKDSASAECTGVEGLACTVSKCSGTNAVSCVVGADKGLDCANYGGGACVTSAAGPSCAPAPDAGTCGSEAAPACEGDVVTACVNGKQTRVDCGALGLPCDVTDVPAHDLAAACIDRAGPCDASTADECAGTLLTSCVRGKTASIDCASFGLGACRTDPRGFPSCGPPK